MWGNGFDPWPRFLAKGSDIALAVEQVTDAAWIQRGCGCGCGVGSNSTPTQETSTCWGVAIKRKEEKKKKRGWSFFFLATPTACGSSWARDWIQAAAAIRATVGTTPDPLTHCAGLGIKPAPLQWPQLLQLDSYPLHDSGNSKKLVFFSNSME